MTEEMLTKEQHNMMEAESETVKLTFPYFGHYIVDAADDSIYLVAWTHPEARGCGHFERLIKELRTEYSSIKTPVPYDNAKKKLLERLGFVEITEFSEETYEDMKIMVWTESLT